MPATIRSVQNPRIKKAVRLRERRGRQQQQRIIVDGLREVSRALEAGILPCEMFLCPELLDPRTEDMLRHQLASADVEPTTVTRDVFAKLSFGQRAEGVVLVARQPHHELDQLRLPSQPLIGVLESVEKPGNLGAILRTAEAAGVSAVVVADALADLYNPNAIRASLGAVFRVPVCAASSSAALKWLKSLSAKIYAARVDASNPYVSVDYEGCVAIVLGSEAHGLSSQWQGPGVTPVALPMLGVVDSLNVSAAAAVLFYEALRQRNTNKLDLDRPN